MKLFLLLAAPLVVSFTQPARTLVQPTRSIAPVDSHLVGHPKTKASTMRAKSSVASTDQVTTARVTQTPVPVVKPAVKARKR